MFYLHTVLNAYSHLQHFSFFKRKGNEIFCVAIILTRRKYLNVAKISKCNSLGIWKFALANSPEWLIWVKIFYPCLALYSHLTSGVCHSLSLPIIPSTLYLRRIRRNINTCMYICTLYKKIQMLLNLRKYNIAKNVNIKKNFFPVIHDSK